MYGLPATFNAGVFVGKVLDEVCFSVNTIGFVFGKDLLITVTGSFIHRDRQNSAVNKEKVPVSSSTLMSLTGKTVKLAEAKEDGTLSLHFGDGHALILLDDDPAYESYIVKVGDKEIIV